MGSFDDWSHRQIKKSQKAKAYKEKKTISRQFDKYTPAVTMGYDFDNDGKPIFPEQTTYRSMGGGEQGARP